MLVEYEALGNPGQERWKRKTKPRLTVSYRINDWGSFNEKSDSLLSLTTFRSFCASSRAAGPKVAHVRGPSEWLREFAWSSQLISDAIKSAQRRAFAWPLAWSILLGGKNNLYVFITAVSFVAVLKKPKSVEDDK